METRRLLITGLIPSIDICGITCEFSIGFNRYFHLVHPEEFLVFVSTSSSYILIQARIRVKISFLVGFELGNWTVNPKDHLLSDTESIPFILFNFIDEMLISDANFRLKFHRLFETHFNIPLSPHLNLSMETRGKARAKK